MRHKPTRLHNRIPILGLIGGIASGKSFVAEEFERQQCAVIDADKIGHDVLADADFQKQLSAAFGSGILASDGGIDRRRLAGLVFGDDVQSVEHRHKLETLVHPEIRRRAELQITRMSSLTQPPPALPRSASLPPAIILDAPLLLEAGWDSLCDYILFVDADDETRRMRAQQRGWNEQQWMAREKAQVSIDAKRRAATHIISGQQSPEELRLRVRQLLSELKDSAS